MLITRVSKFKKTQILFDVEDLWHLTTPPQRLRLKFNEQVTSDVTSTLSQNCAAPNEAELLSY